VKLRSLTEFEDAVDRETAWRKRELTTLLFNVRDARQSKIQVALRGGLAMLYAHWEGWIKAIGEMYVSFVDQQGLKQSQMAAPILGIALKGRIAEVEAANAASLHTEFAEFVLSGGLETKAKLSPKVIQTESNLSSRVLLDITTRLGVPFAPYELLAALIDERLVGARNSIAHGEYLELDEARYEDLHSKVTQMLDAFTTDVLVAARSRSYLRPTA
jgi:hypothetical protein